MIPTMAKRQLLQSIVLKLVFMGHSCYQSQWVLSWMLFPQKSTAELCSLIFKGLCTPARWTAKYLIYYFNWDLAANLLNLSMFGKNSLNIAFR